MREDNDVRLIRKFIQRNETRILVNLEEQERLAEQYVKLDEERDGLLQELEEKLNKQEEK